uniref:uncharacterized protein LOC122597807 n=1 Tax=Erigeron canadensis TaxID=72917 RepID=UPI001CB931ED|nr:uncharacterized protein LOC122597807 [Erigeron canadensis]
MESDLHQTPAKTPISLMEKSRGRGKNKCFWTEDETELLIEVLQEMASDPIWKTVTGFKNNYMVELHRRMVSKVPTFTKQVSPHVESKVKWLKNKFNAICDMVKQRGCRWNNVKQKIKCDREWYISYCKVHKEAKGLWNFEFPYFNQLELVYGRDRANGAIVEANGDIIPKTEVAMIEGNGDASHDTEVEQDTESEDECIGESDDSSDDDEEENGMQHMWQTTPPPGFISRKMPMQRNTTPYKEYGMAKKRKINLSSHDIGTRLDEIESNFRAFAEGFNANFAVMAKAIENAMTNDSIRLKAESEKLKNVIAEVMKLNLSTDDVFKAAEIFAANKIKIDIFFSIPEQLRVSYVIKAFNTNFANKADDAVKAITEDNIRQKAALGKLKDLIAEMMKLDLSNDDILKAADIFAADKSKIDVYFSLPEQLRVSYVSRLIK